MSWNNRIFRHVTKLNSEDLVWYGLHETYYGDDGKPSSWTKEPLDGGYDSVDDLITSLEMKLNDARKYREQVLEYGEEEPVQPSQEGGG